MQQDEQQQQAHLAQDYVERYQRSDKVACLARVGLANEHQYRWIDGGIEVHKAVNIGQCHDVKHHVEYALNPDSDFLWNKRKYHATAVKIEEQLREKVVVQSILAAFG